MPFLQRLHDVEQMHERPGHSAEFRNDYRIAGTEVGQQLMPTGARGVGATRLIGEGFDASCLCQGVPLGIQVLTGAADAGVADNFTHEVCKNKLPGDIDAP